MIPTLQRKKLRVRESLGNLLEINLWHVEETGFKCKSKTESRVHSPESLATLCPKSPFPSFFPSIVED